MFPWGQEGSAEALISLAAHGVGDLDPDRLSVLNKRHALTVAPHRKNPMWR